MGKPISLAIAAVVFAAPLVAQGTDGPWQFRLRAIAVVPDEEATISVINGDVDIDAAYMPEFDITYFLADRVALELILATTKHDVMAIGTDLGDVDVGSVWLLPPTLTLQYHALPEGRARPYVGAGVNLTFFYNEDVPGDVVLDADYDTAVAFAAQAGLDILLGDRGWFLNFDAKKIFLGTDVALNEATILADVDIDPWVAAVGFGYRP